MQNSKQELIIKALLTHPTVREAAESLNLPESTIYNYLRKDDFKSKYNEAKRELLGQATAFLQSKVIAAISVVTNIMNDEEMSPQARLTASRTILEYSLKLTEQVDIIERLEALEGQRQND